jgi:membrane dipeptidase
METYMSDRSEALCANAFIWDAHAGVFPSPQVDLNLLDDWRDNNANYISINVGFDVMGWQQTMATLAHYRRWILANDHKFVLAGTMDDVDAARASGKLAVSFDIEGMVAMNSDINMVSAYYALGVRQMLFAYNLNNDAAGGCHDTDMGLTDFGHEIVTEMNRLGMIVDCSHAAHHTTMDIMETSTRPCVFSHSNPTAIWDHQRNIHDDQIKACAATGGVIGMNGMGIFLGDNDISVDAFMKHICYVCELVGPEHVGLGFDYSPDMKLDVTEILKSRPDFWPKGQQYDTPHIGHGGPPLIPALVDRMFEHGFEDSDIRGILGENFRRVAAATWT